VITENGKEGLERGERLLPVERKSRNCITTTGLSVKITGGGCWKPIEGEAKKKKNTRRLLCSTQKKPHKASFLSSTKTSMSGKSRISWGKKEEKKDFIKGDLRKAREEGRHGLESALASRRTTAHNSRRRAFPRGKRRVEGPAQKAYASSGKIKECPAPPTSQPGERPCSEEAENELICTKEEEKASKGHRPGSNYWGQKGGGRGVRVKYSIGRHTNPHEEVENIGGLEEGRRELLG